MDGIITAARPEQKSDWVPPHSPLEMPIQDLRHRGESSVSLRGEHDLKVWSWRAFVFLTTGALTAYATWAMYQVVGQTTPTLVQIVLVVLFAMTFAWIALSAVTAVIGFLQCMFTSSA